MNDWLYSMLNDLDESMWLVEIFALAAIIAGAVIGFVLVCIAVF